MDFLTYTLDKVARHLNIDPATLDTVDFEIREAKGKDRHYVASAAAKRESLRIARVFAAFRQGLGTREISERLGISQRTVQRIMMRHPMP
jgi:DNA-binding NarL/FixJ family response regulator